MAGLTDEELAALERGESSAGGGLTDEQLASMEADPAEPVSPLSRITANIPKPVAAAGYGAAAMTPVGSFADEAYAAGGAGAYGLAKGIRSILPGGVPEDAQSVGDVYEQLRQRYLQGDQAAFEEQPGAYRTGEAGALLGQLGSSGVKAVASAVRNAPAGIAQVASGQGIPALLKSLGLGGLIGAGQGAVTGAGAAEPGARLEGAGEGAVTGAELGLGFGGLAGLGAAGAARRAGAAQVKGDQARAVEGRIADRTAYPQLAQQARAQAEAQAQAILPERMAKDFGLSGRGQRYGNSAETLGYSQKLGFTEVPDGSGRLYKDLLSELTIPERVQLGEKLKQGVGAQLGEIRQELTQRGASINPKAVQEELRSFVGELPNAEQQEALNFINSRLNDRYADAAGNVSAKGLRNTIEDTFSQSKGSSDSLGRFYAKVYDTLTGAERSLVQELGPGNLERYNKLVPQYRDAARFTEGADRLNQKIINETYRPRQPDYAATAVPKPPGPSAPFGPGPYEGMTEAQLAQQSMQVGGPMRKAANYGVATAGGAAGAALGGSVGAATGIPFAGYAGAGAGMSGGYAAGKAVADKLLPLVRPSTGKVIALSEKAANTLAKYSEVVDTLVRSGSTATVAWHRAKLATDPEYKAAIDEQTGGGRKAGTMGFNDWFTAWRSQ